MSPGLGKICPHVIIFGALLRKLLHGGDIVWGMLVYNILTFKILFSLIQHVIVNCLAYAHRMHGIICVIFYLRVLDF